MSAGKTWPMLPMRKVSGVADFAGVEDEAAFFHGFVEGEERESWGRLGIVEGRDEGGLDGVVEERLEADAGACLRSRCVGFRGIGRIGPAMPPSASSSSMA